MKINSKVLQKLIDQTKLNTSGNIIPILDFLLLEKWNEKEVRMKNTNLNTFIFALGETIECEDGFVCLLHRNEIVELINNLPETEIEITNDLVSGRVKITWSQGEYFLFSGDVNDYPSFNETEIYNSTFNIYGNVFKSVFNIVSTTVGHDELRPVMTGIHVEIKGNELQATSTNAISLSHEEIGSISRLKDKDDFDFIIPIEMATILSKYKDDEDDIYIACNEYWIGTNINKKVFIISKQIAGKFPNWKAVIPTEHDKKLCIEKKVLKSAVERAIVFNKASLREGIIFNLRKNELLIGDYREDVVEEDLFSVKERSSCAYDGDDLNIAFNPNIMLKMLKSIDSHGIVMELTQASKPVILRPDDKDAKYYYLIMPIQLSDGNKKNAN